MKKQDFLTLRRVKGHDFPIYQRISGYLYGIRMPHGKQYPFGMYKDGKNGWQVVDLLTGRSWSTSAQKLSTKDEAFTYVEGRVVSSVWVTLRNAAGLVISENREQYEMLMEKPCFVDEGYGVFIEWLDRDNLPRSCITFDSAGRECLC